MMFCVSVDMAGVWSFGQDASGSIPLSCTDLSVNLSLRSDRHHRL